MELFDLAADPREARDLSARERTRTTALRARLREWRKTVGAQENTVNPGVDLEMHKRIYLDFDSTRFDPLHAGEAAWKRAAEWRQQMNAATRRPPSP